MTTSGEGLFESRLIGVNANSFGFLDFILMDSLFQISYSLLLCVHSLGHSCDQLLFPMWCVIQSLVMLILLKLIFESLVVVSTFVFIESIRFDRVIHIFKSNFLWFLSIEFFLHSNGVLLNDIVFLLQAILSLISDFRVVVSILL